MKNFLKKITKTPDTKKYKRIAVYVPEEDYNILKSRLMLTPYKNVSRWIREKIKSYILEGGE